MTTFRSVRTAGGADAVVVADLLDRFNREYETPTPGPCARRGGGPSPHESGDGRGRRFGRSPTPSGSRAGR